MKSVFTLVPLLTSAFLCGAADASNIRIIGGDKVSLDQYPYMAALVGRGQSAEQAYCGASVINTKWILTAAHCLTGVSANSLDVITGVAVLSEADSGQRIAASRIIVHPEYNDNSLVNDIALIELTSATSAPAVQAASSADREVFAVGQPVSVSGWGNLSTSGQEYPDVLHAVDLQVSDFAACADAYGALANSHICATVPGGKKDSCQGDSGGPLIAKTTKGAIQVGIVSFGDACASATHPGVYTKVSEFSEFLELAGVDSSIELAETQTITPVEPADQPLTEDNDVETDSTVNTDVKPAEVAMVEVEPIQLPASSETSVSVNDSSVNDSIEANVVAPFFHILANETSWAFVEFYNAGADVVSLSNIQLPNGVSIDAASEDCTAYELFPEEACYMDLNWLPVEGNNLNGELSIDVFDGESAQTLLLPLLGVVLEPVDIGEQIDWPMAEYFSAYPEEWDLDNSDAASGDSSVSSDMQNTESLDLIGVFDEQENHELQFEYQLDGVHCNIYVDDELAYELAAFEQWQQASLDVPAGSEVRWEFKAMTRDSGLRKVRLDALKISTEKELVGSSLSINPIASTTASVVNDSADSGAGATGLYGLIALIMLMVFRSGVLPQRRLS